MIVVTFHWADGTVDEDKVHPAARIWRRARTDRADVPEDQRFVTFATSLDLSGGGAPIDIATFERRVDSDGSIHFEEV